MVNFCWQTTTFSEGEMTVGGIVSLEECESCLQFDQQSGYEEKIDGQDGHGDWSCTTRKSLGKTPHLLIN